MAELTRKNAARLPFVPDLREFLDPLPTLPVLVGRGAAPHAVRSIGVRVRFEARAERTEERTEKHHTGFRYGTQVVRRARR